MALRQSSHPFTNHGANSGVCLVCGGSAPEHGEVLLNPVSYTKRAEVFGSVDKDGVFCRKGHIEGVEFNEYMRLEELAFEGYNPPGMGCE